MDQIQTISISIRRFLETVTARSIHDSMRFLKTAGVSMPQFAVMMRLHHGGGCRVSDIARHMEITNAAASQLIDGLVAKGFLERVEKPEDRRIKQISISSRGIKFIQDSINERNRWVEELVAELSPEEQRLVINALPALEKASAKLTNAKEHEV